jgi:2-alkyl-3-oxoalkanoate reductase
VVTRVVVTGGAGMLGGGLVERLVLEGHSVHGIDLRPGRRAAHGGGEARHSVGDIRDPELLGKAMADADAVVHCAAALPSYPADEIHSVIVDGTRNVMESAYRAGVPRVVHISSTAVYGLPRMVPTPEDYPLEPVDAYSRAKVAAEAVCEGFRTRGMCVPVLRPKTFLGPGRMGLFSMLFEWAEEGHNFPVLGRGDVRIQMFAMDDLLDAIMTTLRAEPDVAGDTFNVGAAEFGTLREDFQVVLDAAGHGKRVVSIPARPGLLALRLLERTHLSPVYGRLLHKLLADSYVSIDRARERLGFTPRLSNRDAILATYAWWRRHQAANAGGARTGQTSRDAWSQGALTLAKALF